MNDSPINKEDYLIAKELVNKYETANPPILNNMNNSMLQKPPNLPINSNIIIQ